MAWPLVQLTGYKVHKNGLPSPPDVTRQKVSSVYQATHSLKPIVSWSGQGKVSRLKPRREMSMRQFVRKSVCGVCVCVFVCTCVCTCVTNSCWPYNNYPLCCASGRFMIFLLLSLSLSLSLLLSLKKEICLGKLFFYFLKLHKFGEKYDFKFFKTWSHSHDCWYIMFTILGISVTIQGVRCQNLTYWLH